MKNPREMHLPLDSATREAIARLADLTEDTFDAKGDFDLAKGILLSTVDDMLPSNVWRIQRYTVGDYILEKRKYYWTRKADLSIRRREQEGNDQPNPVVKIIFDRNTHAIKAIDRIHYLDAMGVMHGFKERMWPPRRKPLRS